MVQRIAFIREGRALRPALFGRIGLLVAAAVLVAAGLTGCRSTPRLAQDTNVFQGDALHGRLVPGREAQSFAFEGVESSLLDFTVQSDVGSTAAPVVTVLDPDGRALDVAAATRTEPGSATMRVEGLVLTRTGTYKVMARPSRPDATVFYSFKHEIRYAPMPDTKAYLSADAPRPIRVSAPRGGLIAVSIKPDSGSNLLPDIQGVQDPWGGPALDRSQVPPGCNPPRVSHSFEGAMILTFVAPRPGTYTILAAAKRGRPGVGVMHVDVKRPRWPVRSVYHNDSAASGFGLPAPPAGQPTAGAPATSAQFPPPLPPPAPAVPPASVPPSPPVDAPIAVR